MPYQPADWTSRNGRTYRTMTQYDARHLSVLVVLILCCGILVVAARNLPRSTVKAARKVAGAVLGITVAAYYLWVLAPRNLVWDETAPFHITDFLRVITPVALLTDHPTVTALSFYWGFLLNPMALLFPDMAYVQDRPGLQELAYWFFHCAALVVPTVLTFGLGYRPSWRDWRITTAITIAWAGLRPRPTSSPGAITASSPATRADGRSSSSLASGRTTSSLLFPVSPRSGLR